MKRNRGNEGRKLEGTGWTGEKQKKRTGKKKDEVRKMKSETLTLVQEVLPSIMFSFINRFVFGSKMKETSPV